MSEKKDIHQQSFYLNRELFNEAYKHKAKVVWFTGLSGSGKSTLANEVSKLLFEHTIKVFTLDGDNTRLGLNKDLGFSLTDRKENIRRVAEVAKLFVDSGTVVLASFISPIEEERSMAKQIIGKENFIEVFVDCSLEQCEKRDVKGLYAKARAGEIKNFTGIDSPYEKPSNPDITVNTAEQLISECSQIIFNMIKSQI
jgi:adenylylsulfate kinase